MKIVKYLLIILVSFGAVACSKKAEPPPIVLVIFGASGDLTAKKIVPAVEKLAGEGYLPEKFAVVGVARRDEAEIRKQTVFGHKFYYCQANFDEEQGYENLAQLLNEIDRGFGVKSNRIYFLSTQPSYFSTIVEKLSTHNLIYQPGRTEWSRVMIEKPFGHDLPSALYLQEQISRYLDESQIYRIDHYLGKGGVQNLIDFRFKKELEPIWDNEHIERVQITLSEEIGIGTRANLWEETGLLRDIVQNHIMQLLSLVAMEVPSDKNKIAEEKVHLLNAVRLEKMVRGQYGPGVINGESVVSYKEEKGVPQSSNAETFVSAQLSIDNDRWKGVPFEIRGGKRLSAQITEIVVTFKTQEKLHIRIQPNPAIYFQNTPEISLKAPLFSEAYQKIIYDCIHGDQSSFVQKEEQFAAWRILAPYLKAQDQIVTYPAGSAGPL